MTKELEKYHYPKVYRQLLRYVEHHELQILHEDGQYRHLRFKSPGTSIGYFDLVTWPGTLAVSGDIGEGFIFKREDDMVAWFGPNRPDGHINADYWSEKLTRGTREVREVFSEEKFDAYLDEQIKDFSEHNGQTVEEVAEHVKSEREFDYIASTEAAYLFVDGLNFEGRRIVESPSDDIESWVEYDHHFLLACHAILWGIKKYQKGVDA